MTAGKARRLAACGGWLAIVATAGVSAQSVSFAPVGSMTGPANIVKVQGTYAYVAAGKTLAVFDISNPAEPKRTGAYTFPEQVWGFTPVGPLVYVAADVFGLGILDVSNATAPTLRGSFKTSGQAKGVAVVGKKALVADHVSGLDLIDVSNPEKPVSLESFFLEGFAKDVMTSGSLVYAVDMPTGFSVFDLSKPGPLQAASTLQSAIVSGTTKLSDVSATKGTTLVALVGDGVLQVYDVSNPAAPVNTTTYRSPGGALRVSLEGRLAYIAAGAEGLQVVDLSTPSKPSIAGAYKTVRPARDVTVADSLVFVVVGTDEVLILRRTP